MPVYPLLAAIGLWAAFPAPAADPEGPRTLRAQGAPLFEPQGERKPALDAVPTALGKPSTALKPATAPPLRLEDLRNPVWTSPDNLRDPSVLKTSTGYDLFYSRLSSGPGGWGNPTNWAIASFSIGLGQRAGASTNILLDTYNYVIGTQTIGAAYQFTPEPKLVETARAILAMGSTTLKFSLTPQAETAPKPRTLEEIVERDPAVKAVLELPFANYVMWVSPRSAPGGGPFAPSRLEAERQEVGGLTRRLLKTYNGSGKSFYLGNWEGDWLLTRTNPNYTPTAEEIENMVHWGNARQEAVDEARRATPHTNVNVYYYIEVNRVRDAMAGRSRVANLVLPRVNPDFVSYSSYDSQQGDVERTFGETLDYLQARLSHKPEIPGKRVFIGEYGLPLLGNSAESQDRLARQVMRAGLRWGCPFVLYWEMYNNEVTPEGRQRGFWLIDDQGKKQPVYFTHQTFYAKARAYLADFKDRNGRVPDREEFGRAAVAWLPLVNP